MKDKDKINKEFIINSSMTEMFTGDVSEKLFEFKDR